MDEVMFSVITVTLNAENEIQSTIQSILSQTYENFEVIVKDGGSRDKTCQLLPKDDRIKVIQKKDCSVYDGMNQAVEFVHGDYIIFMNAGDTFYNETVLESVAKYIEINQISKDIVLYGDYKRDDRINRQKNSLRQMDLYRKHLCHQSIFYSENLFRDIGRFDLDYHICADHEFTVRLWSQKVAFRHIDMVVCNYMGNGLSENIQNLKLAKEEKKEIVNSYFSGLKHIAITLIVFYFAPTVRKFIGH